jgi:hypothetical protein
MHDRCKATHKSRKDYYDKGVIIDARWDNYDTFFADMGQRPTGMTLDRIDNNLGYTKNNCRWADATTQMNNRTCVTKYEYQGETKSLTQWSRDKRCVVTACTLYARVLKYKFEFIKSLITPKGEWK